MEATPRGTSQRTRFKFDKAMPKAKSYATTYTAAGIGDLLDFLHPHLTGQCCRLHCSICDPSVYLLMALPPSLLVLGLRVDAAQNLGWCQRLPLPLAMMRRPIHRP